MASDEQKQIRRALLDRYPQGHFGAMGFQQTASAKGLFALACFAALAESAVPSRATAEALHAVFDEGWDSAFEMAKASDEDLAAALREAGASQPDAAAATLSALTRAVCERYDGDLRGLREEAGGDPRHLRALLGELPGMDEAGLAVFRREAQIFWHELAPFADAAALRAAGRLGLPADAQALMDDIVTGQDTAPEQLAFLVGALDLVDANGEEEEIARAAGTPT